MCERLAVQGYDWVSIGVDDRLLPWCISQGMSQVDGNNNNNKNTIVRLNRPKARTALAL